MAADTIGDIYNTKTWLRKGALYMYTANSHYNQVGYNEMEIFFPPEH